MDTPITRAEHEQFQLPQRKDMYDNHIPDRSLPKVPICKGSGGASTLAAAIWRWKKRGLLHKGLTIQGIRSLNHSEIADILNVLPYVTLPAKLTLVGDLSAIELTDEEKAIATGKNWTLILRGKKE